MPQVDRFSVSMDTELLAAFDHHIARKGYVNRSEAVRDMIRDMLLTSRLPDGDDPVLAVLSFLCDQRTGDAAARLRDIAIEAGDLVLGSWHTPADQDHDVVVMTLRGPSDLVQAAAERIQALRGTAHTQLTLLPAADRIAERS